jgi:hypothetical protein
MSSKNTTYLIFLLLLLLNIVLHYPTVPHEIGWDSFVVHSAANSLSELGFAKWWLNPTSVIGSYPYSIASAVPFLTSGISQLTGLSMDTSIFIYSTILGLICIFVTYLLANSIYGNNDYLFSFLVAFGFSTSPAILTFTSWTAPTRTLFAVVLLPFILYLSLKTNQSNKFYILLFFMGALGLVTHHYAYFIPLIIICELFLKIGYRFKQYIPIKYSYKNIYYLSFFAMAIILPFFTRVFMESERGYSGTRYGFLLMLISSYSRHSGILLIFALSGFVYLALKSQKNHEEWFILTSFAALSPFFYIETYMKWFLPSYVFIFSSIGLTNIFKNKKAVLIVLMLFSIIVSGYLQFLHFLDDESRFLDEESYSSGIWISNQIEGNLTGTAQYATLRMYSISQVPTLTISNMLNYIDGFISYNDTMVIKKYPISSLSYYRDNPYSINNEDGEWYVNSLSNWNINDRRFKEFIDRFNISYFVVDEKADSNEFSYSLATSNNNSKIFSSGRVSIWN